jgi:hypothetical protein
MKKIQPTFLFDLQLFGGMNPVVRGSSAWTGSTVYLNWPGNAQPVVLWIRG